VRKPREQDTVAAILQLLHAHRIPAWRMNTGAMKVGTRFLRFGVTGMSDIIGVMPVTLDCTYDASGRTLTRTSFRGSFLAIEVKSATGKTTPAQDDFLARVNAAGGKGFVARSVGDVQKELGL
jgi:hypothetical protein